MYSIYFVLFKHNLKVGCRKTFAAAHFIVV